MYEKILLAFDGSEYAIQAAKKAIRIASLNSDSVIEVIYVVGVEESKKAVLSNHDKFSIKASREKQVAKAKSLADSAGVHYVTNILRGEPADVIVKYAAENGHDVIILGKRGLSPLKSVLMGSVSYEVSKRAHCDLIISKKELSLE